ETRNKLLSACELENSLLFQLGGLMQKKHIPLPALGAFPTHFTSMNYVSLSFLIPRLIATERQTLTDLERDLPQVKDQQIHQVLGELLDSKRRHLAGFESLMPQPKAA